MASNVAPPKNTGGGGFVFEDDVCAWMLACILAGEPIFDVGLGAPLRLDFQTRPDGWFLDDVLVTTAVGPVHHRFATSIKSNPQFTASTAPADFVSCIWEQWLHIGSVAFDPARDFMVLVTAPLSAAAASSVSGLGEKARVADPNLLPSRLATAGWATEDERDLFASFACPRGLNIASTDVDTARLLQRLRFLHRDFGIATSDSLKAALSLCRRAVRSHTDDDAQVLWSLLRGVAAELRPRAGSITLHGLIDRLRGGVALADYPDHASDWTTLDARSQRDATLVPDSVASRIRIPRDAKTEELAAAVAVHQQIALLGPSGVGKSVLARAVFEQRHARGERTLWLDARSLDCADFGMFESALRLRYPLADLLSAATAQDPLLVIDGLDRLYSAHAFRNAAALLRLARQEPPSTRWRIVAPCQSQEWPRVLEAVQRAGAASGQWTTVQLEALKPSDLRPVGEAVPALKATPASAEDCFAADKFEAR